MSTSFISRLLGRADEAYEADPANFFDDVVIRSIENDPLVVKEKLPLEISNDTISLRLRSLRTNRAALQSEIERLSLELYETNVSIEAFEAAEAVILPKLAPPPADNVLKLPNT